MNELYSEIQQAIAHVHAQQADLPIIVANQATIDFVEATFPWYPSDKLVASAAAIEGKALVIDPTLDWRP